jgi:BASS family bile acid:Na+ symporter
VFFFGSTFPKHVFLSSGSIRRIKLFHHVLYSSTQCKGSSGDKGKLTHNKQPCEKIKRHLNVNGGSPQGNEDGHKPLGSSFQKPAASTSYEGQQEGTIEIRRARHKGRVGTYIREGNVSLASFGIKVKRDKKGQKVDVTKSLSQLLPYVVLATAVSALTQPASFAWVSKDYYAPALGGIMLSIGVQLSVSDFTLVLKRPLPVLVGYMSQYMVKPLLGLLVCAAFSVSPAFSSGLILTSCVAGAQLSSYAAFLSEGDVALSIILTSLTTVTSVIITPLLTKLLIGSVVPVDIIAMGKSILQVVILPIVLGLSLNTYAKGFVDKIRTFMPLMAMVCTSLCIGSPLALNRSRIVSMEGFRLLFPVLAFHIGAFVLGYWIPRLPFWKQDEKVSRTISLCTGMQSSTLAMLLATQFLGGSHAVPPACSVVVMAIMGLSLASFWGKGHEIRDMKKVLNGGVSYA